MVLDQFNRVDITVPQGNPSTQCRMFVGPGPFRATSTSQWPLFRGPAGRPPKKQVHLPHRGKTVGKEGLTYFELGASTQCTGLIEIMGGDCLQRPAPHPFAIPRIHKPRNLKARWRPPRGKKNHRLWRQSQPKKGAGKNKQGDKKNT